MIVLDPCHPQSKEMRIHNPAVEVVARHLRAVASGVADSMAADYAVDAVLMRDRAYSGIVAIREYFASVGDRLGDGQVIVKQLRSCGDAVVVDWNIAGGPGSGVAGVDTYTVVDGLIVLQVVQLEGRDF